MDDSQAVVHLGRIKWFDAERGHGVVGDVGGGNYRFELPENATGMAPGELVTFSVAGGGLAGGVTKMGSGPHTEVAA